MFCYGLERKTSEKREFIGAEGNSVPEQCESPAFVHTNGAPFAGLVCSAGAPSHLTSNSAAPFWPLRNDRRSCSVRADGPRDVNRAPTSKSSTNSGPVTHEMRSLPSCAFLASHLETRSQNCALASRCCQVRFMARTNQYGKQTFQTHKYHVKLLQTKRACRLLLADDKPCPPWR